MKKILIMVLCLLLCMTACAAPDPTENGNLPEGVSYAIEVVDTAGNPIPGAMVVLCQDKEGGTCYMPGSTDENGIAYFHSNMIPVQNDMKVRVLMAEGYDLPLDDSGDIRYTQIPDGTVYMTLQLEKIEN